MLVKLVPKMLGYNDVLKRHLKPINMGVKSWES